MGITRKTACRYRPVRAPAAAAAIVLPVLLLVCGSASRAETIDEALAQAYLTNPSLKAAQAEVRVNDESVPTALAGWRPRVDAIAGGGYVYTNNADENRSQNTTFSSSNGPTVVAQLRLRQPIYDQSVAPNVERAKALVKAKRQELRAAEQAVLLEAADAYLTVLRAEQVIRYRNAYLQTLTSNQASSRRLRERGVINEGTLAEAVSQQAAARAEVGAAEATLAVSRDQYQQTIGAPPGEVVMPYVPAGLPSSAEEAVLWSQAVPAVVASRLSESAAKENVDVQLGTLFPRADLQGTLDPLSMSVIAVVTIPLFDPLLSPRVRQSKEQVSRSRFEFEKEERLARQNALNAWYTLQSARSRLPALAEQVKAAEIAAGTAEREGALGIRSMTDMLAIQGNAYRARVDQLGAECDMRLAAYQLLAATGRLTSTDLQLRVPVYNPKTHYDDVKGQWFGLGPDISE